MEIRAELNYVRVSPRKVRLVADMIRGAKAQDARTQLKFLPKKSSGMILKLLDSAIANAKHNFSLAAENLYIAKIFVNGGPILKRMMPRAFGRSAGINKRTSHITIVLDEIAPGKGKVKPAKRVKMKEEKGASTDAVALEDGVEAIETKDKEKHSLQSAIRESKKTQQRKPKEFMKKVFRRKVI